MKQEFRKPLRDHVIVHHQVCWHAGDHGRSCLLVELGFDARVAALDVALDFERQAHAFYKQSFLMNINNPHHGGLPPGDETQNLRDLLEFYAPAYREASGYQPVQLICAAHHAEFYATRMVAAHKNVICQEFGRRLREVVDVILDAHGRHSTARHRLSNTTDSTLGLEEQTSASVFSQLEPVRQAVGRLQYVDVPNLPQLERELLWDLVMTMQVSYPQMPDFLEGTIYVDALCHPLRHARAMVRLAAWCERNNLILSMLEQRRQWEVDNGAPGPSTPTRRIRFPEFEALPHRKDWIPAMVIIDTTIASMLFLHKHRETHADNRRVWAKIVQLQRRIFRQQGSLTFQGTILTDGASVAVLKQTTKPNPEQGEKRPAPEPAEEDEMMETCGQVDLHQMDQENACSGNLHQILKNAASGAEDHESHHHKSKKAAEFKHVEELDPADLLGKLVVAIDPGQRDVAVCMREDSTAQEHRVIRNTSQTRLVETGQRRRRQLLLQRKTPEVKEAELRLARESPGSRTYTQEGFLEYVRVRAAVAPVLRAYYEDLYFRNLRAEAYWMTQKADARFIKMFKQAFGPNVIVVIGDWSRQGARHHPPMPDLKLKRLLRQAGYDVYLIDEYRTSKLCSCCEEELHPARTVQNPRSFRRATHPWVDCWGLRKCESNTCDQAMAELRRRKQQEREGQGQHNGAVISNGTWHRCWDRDINAVLNMIKIIKSLRQGLGRPLRYRPPTAHH